MNRRKKDAAEGKPADPNAKKDDKKPAKKPCKKGKRGREPSASTSLPVASSASLQPAPSLTLYTRAQHACLLVLCTAGSRSSQALTPYYASDYH